ncbi:hypothetical protein CJF36_21870 [Pseudomonas lundensis]|nr:hypothetical protein CJF36_21870 [Pseudomonas lundensis]
MKKVRVSDDTEDDYKVDVSTLTAEERFAFLENKKGVSNMLVSITKNKGLIINGSDKSDMKDIEKKFTRNNSNISQLQTLCEGQSINHNDKILKHETLFKEFIEVKIILGKIVSEILSHKTTKEVTKGPAIEARIELINDIDFAGTLREHMTFVTDEDTYNILKTEGECIRTNIKNLIREHSIFKEGAPTDHPFIIEALEIYQRLNRNTEAAHVAIKENKPYQVMLYKNIHGRKNEMIALIKKHKNL